MLRKSPHERFRSAAELRGALAGYLAGGTTPDPVTDDEADWARSD
jgi:hypothetical protein